MRSQGGHEALVRRGNPRDDAPCPSDLIQSLQRGLRILEFVSAAPGPVAPKEVAAGTGLKLATAYHLINTLLHEGYLRRVAGQGLEIGAQVAGRPRGAADFAQPHCVPILRALGAAAYSISDVVLLTVMDRSKVVVLAAQEVPGAPNGGRYPVGSCHLPHESAAGRAMLSAQEPRRAERVLDHCRALAASWGTEFDHTRVHAELERGQRHGVSFARTGTDACVGAPVFDRHGEGVGAVALVVSPSRLSRESQRLVNLAQATAASVSRTITRLELSGHVDDRLRALMESFGVQPAGAMSSI